MLTCSHCGSRYIKRKPGTRPSKYCIDCFNPNNHKQRIRFIRYKVTEGEYQAMYFDQDGACAICQEAEATVVDHDHITGKVRGLLCQPCNRGLGQFKDSTSNLQAAYFYLSEV